jgi:hypothetical protein
VKMVGGDPGEKVSTRMAPETVLDRAVMEHNLLSCAKVKDARFSFLLRPYSDADRRSCPCAAIRQHLVLRSRSSSRPGSLGSGDDGQEDDRAGTASRLDRVRCFLSLLALISSFHTGADYRRSFSSQIDKLIWFEGRVRRLPHQSFNLTRLLSKLTKHSFSSLPLSPSIGFSSRRTNPISKVPPPAAWATSKRNRYTSRASPLPSDGTPTSARRPKRSRRSRISSSRGVCSNLSLLVLSQLSLVRVQVARPSLMFILISVTPHSIHSECLVGRRIIFSWLLHAPFLLRISSSRSFRSVFPLPFTKPYVMNDFPPQRHIYLLTQTDHNHFAHCLLHGHCRRFRSPR